MEVSPKYNKLFSVIFLLVWIAGVALRCYCYFMGRPLWEDEAHLALNFISHDYIGLTKPLDNFQSAPILFLYAVESTSHILGYGEMALRSFPFIISILTLPLFYFFVHELTKSITCAIIAFFIFSLNLSLIYYSSELKPYTIDVSFYVVMGYLFLSKHPYIEHRRKTLLTIAGCLGILLTNASTVILGTGFLYLLYTAWRDKAAIRKLLPMFTCWTIIWIANAWKFVLFHPYAGGMKEIWSWTFVPIPFTENFGTFMTQRLDDTIFSYMLFFSKNMFFPYILLLVILVAIGNICFKRRWNVFLFAILPILLHMVLSMFKLYPFFFRFILYLLPPLIILTALGISTIASWLQKKAHTSIAIIFVVFCCYCCSAESVKRFPHWTGDPGMPQERNIKPVLNYINEHYHGKPTLVTTPWTLFQYYRAINYVNNTGESIDWSLSPEQFFSNEKIKKQRTNFLLLHSASGEIDGYKTILDSLKNRDMIVQQYQYGTYGITEIKGPSE
jgi:hypothetical protein